MHVQMHVHFGIKIFSLRSYKNTYDCTCSKHDDKLNTSAFVNFLLVKIFPTKILHHTVH